MSKRVEAALVYWNESGFMKYRVWELEQETRQDRTNKIGRKRWKFSADLY